MIRVYLETTVFNRYFEEGREYCAETKLLFDKIFTPAEVIENESL